MLEVGDTIFDAVVQSAPGAEVRLAELAGAGPLLLLFYLFDWSST